MTLEEALAEVASCGLLVNNLFQQENGEWTCSLRDRDNGADFATASTPQQAVMGALLNFTLTGTVPLLRQTDPKATKTTTNLLSLDLDL